ncbi:hypothetical protein BGX27_006742 [Mortierella sp. AM989]|nr:hypothetical protein BGX27_006742 [Mortierella sp. AM989]
MATIELYPSTNAIIPTLIPESGANVQAPSTTSSPPTIESSVPPLTYSDITTSQIPTTPPSPSSTQTTTSTSTSSTYISTTTSTGTGTSTFTQSTTLSTSIVTTATTKATDPIVSPTNGPSHQSRGGGLSTGAIVGIAIGCAVGLAVIIVLLFLALRRHKRRKADFNSNIMFNPINMSQHRPSSGDRHNVGASTHRYTSGDGDPIMVSTMSNEDGASAFPRRSGDRMHHADNIPSGAVLGTDMYGYEADNRQRRRPQQYYPAADHHHDPSHITHPDQETSYVQYQQEWYQPDHDWHDVAGRYYGPEHEYHGGYGGYYGDHQYTDDVHGYNANQPSFGYEFDAGEVSGPGSSGLSGNQVSPAMETVPSNRRQYNHINNDRNTEYIDPESDVRFEKNTSWGDAPDSSTIKVESIGTAVAASSTAGSRAEAGEDAYSKRFSQHSMSQASTGSTHPQSHSPRLNSAPMRGPHALLSDTEK